MSSHQMDNYSQQFETFQEQESAQKQAEEYFIRRRLRNQAYKRVNDYTHPRVNFFDHHPIDSTESQELRKQLITLYKPKAEFVRGQYDPQQLTKDYEHTYEQFVEMTVKNQQQEKLVTESIGEMHEMANLLLEGGELMSEKMQTLHLYDKSQATENQEQQINSVFEKYQQAYKQGIQVENNQAQQTIKMAKIFLRSRYS